ncbi:low molecular weight protein-tyrosine-phosphatase [Allorhodopirellula solitaria]|uniref:Low molecular weight protein-tyrosine-phosphatase YfkJ n=1 Tax=Allorhodopirellula solitaria TaxID=2527987 RepID=A0A5C5YHS0_9BACT|nr:low molecular weight protein-tyrosine-phosphatase [Allorhodopirellula solitaria]TWT73192.1 Low molecular weight protein-tyrosine-phosphatase YfkJ [Allorhodopirellula solitaria]
MPPNTVPKSVLFVCLGNICRSPTGEGMLTHALAESGLSDAITVDSAGTAGYHIGKPADARMQRAAERRGVALHSRARQLSARDLQAFDLVIAMDRENQAGIEGLRSPAGGEERAEIRLLSTFLDDSWPVDVPDPYHGDAAGFEYVVDMIAAACPEVIAYLQSGQSS